MPPLPARKTIKKNTKCWPTNWTDWIQTTNSCFKTTCYRHSQPETSLTWPCTYGLHKSALRKDHVIETFNLTPLATVNTLLFYHGRVCVQESKKTIVGICRKLTFTVSFGGLHFPQLIYWVLRRIRRLDGTFLFWRNFAALSPYHFPGKWVSEKFVIDIIVGVERMRKILRYE